MGLRCTLMNLIRVMPAQGRDCDGLMQVTWRSCERALRGKQKSDVDFLIAGSQRRSCDEETDTLSGRFYVR